MDDDALREALTRGLRELIAIPSTHPPGDTRAIMDYAAKRLAAAGYAVETVARRDGVANVVARRGRGRPVLAFNAHADTVGPGERAAWRSDPFAAAVAGERIRGLGACNCKGPMAVQLWLAEEIARRGGPQAGEVVFSFVGDEEALGADGTRYLRDSGKLRPDMLVVAAPTGNRLIVEERGVFQARVTASGRAAHAGEPENGDNAILRMLRIVAALERKLGPEIKKRVRGPMRSTMSVGVISGGTTANVVPASCSIEIDRRLLPDETVNAAFAELREAVATAGEPDGTLAVELLAGTNGFAAARDARVVQAFAAACEQHLKAPAKFVIPIGASDGRYFADDKIEILVTGPGDDREGHAANESIAIPELLDAAHIHLGAVERLLGFAGPPA